MYRKDVFISYKWLIDGKEWVREIFYPILKSYFSNFYGKDSISIDKESIINGNTLNESIKNELIYAKCMISVITRPYFEESYWCTIEFSTFHHREQQLGFRTTDNVRGLIFPIMFCRVDPVTGSEEHFHYPTKAHELAQSFLPLYLDVGKFFHTHKAFRDSEDYTELRSIIFDWLSKAVVPAIRNAPEWKPEFALEKEWIEDPYNEFVEKYIKAKDAKSEINLPLPSIR